MMQGYQNRPFAAEQTQSAKNCWYSILEFDALKDLDKETRVNGPTVLQLRVHPSLVALKERLDSEQHENHQVQLTYITSRDRYQRSLKGDVKVVEWLLT